MSFFNELKRRNVFRVGIAYVIVGWLTMQVGEVMAPALNLPDWVLSALAFFVILGFPLALFFAWAFEMTPEGLKLEKDVDRAQSITHVTSQKLNNVIIGLLVLALAYFVFDKFALHRHEDTQPIAVEEAADQGHSIAVLPLADMSPQGDHEYFSDGLTEELLNILAKIRELRVTGRTSSFAFKGKNEDLREIGRKLNVESILEGSVRKDEARNRVRITLQLINAQDGYHLWSETYDRDLDDIFAIQEEVAIEVANALRITLLGEDQARLDHVASTGADSYDLYLQAKSELAKSGFVNLDRAQELFQQVLAMDPAYTPARLGLVETWSQMANTGAITVREALDRGLPMLRPILEQDPDNTVALRLMAKSQADAGNMDSAERHFQRALELDPRDAATLRDYGRFLYDARWQAERGVALIDAAVAIEPYATDILWDSCSTSAHLGEFEKSLAACRRMQEIEPDGPQGYYGEALANAYQGNMPHVLLGYSRAIERDPEDFEMVAAMSIFWVALGDGQQAGKWLDRAEAIGAGRPVPTHARILLFEFNEQYDRAGELAARALAQNMDDRHGTQFFFRRANASHAMRTGNWEAGLAPYRELLPWVFEAELVFPENASVWIDDIIHVAALMKRADPLAQRPDLLLDFAERNIDHYYPAWGKSTVPIRLAAIHAVRGQNREAAAQLREVLGFGLEPLWRQHMIYEPAFSQLQDEPEYRAVIADAEVLAEQQRTEAHVLLRVES